MAKIKCPECGRVVALTIVPQDAPPELEPKKFKYFISIKLII